ncbi:non sense mediated decay [Hyphodiscus hymeniophilus]|uniref:Non sense mediated decay n=1 Tax=Hyphodiscus hymeniophilus TaxID=353542 RepID=A0A9P6SKK9_9HELO|nr:non sense mediated decay [Hyphodiscus hymeniophilus]
MPLAAGSIFGAALTSAGVYHPAVIIGQMTLQDFTMLKVFLTAAAISASIISITTTTGVAKVQPRASSTVGLFGRYDANIIGGVLLGIGSSLTGACPGTVFPQIATGVRSSLFVFLGGITGAVLFERLAAKSVTQGKRATVHSTLGVHETWSKVIYQATCMIIVAVAAYLVPGNRNYWVSPYIGGILIACITSAYASIAHWITSTTSRNQKNGHDYRSVVFVTGALLGSWALSRIEGPLPSAPLVHISAIKASIGGALSIFGARLSGGCTSGHGITGMSQLSISSFITIAAMFGGGVMWSFLV